MVNEDLKGKFKDSSKHVTEQLTGLVQSYYKLGLVHLTDKSSAIISTSLVLILTALLSLFVLFFAGIGIGFWLGHQLDSMFAGFSIVALVYLLLATTIYLTRNQVLIPFFRNRIITKVYENQS
jgi:uncharacterized membrane protein YqjE